MPSVLDSILALIGTALAVGVLATSAALGCLRRLFFVNLYAAVVLLSDGARYFTLHYYGFRSYQYFYIFYITDALLVTATYLLILSFFETIFGKSSLRTVVRWALLFFVILVALVSNAMISRSLPHFHSRLLVEFLQNMYFAAVILTVLLWISLNYLRVDDRQIALLVAGLGLSLSLQAANYAMQNLLSRQILETLHPLVLRVPPLAMITKLGLWCYAISCVAQNVPVVRRVPVSATAEAKGSA